MLATEFKSDPNKFGGGFATVEFKPQPLPNQLPYDMPTVHLGQVVLWFANCSPSSPPEPCTVQKVNHRTVLLTANNPNAVVPSYAVVHAGDPGVGNPNIRKNGCWDYTKWDHLMMRRMERLEKIIGHLLTEMGIEDPDAPKPLPVETEEERQRKAAELEAALAQDVEIDE